MGSVGLCVGLGPGSKFSLWYGLGWSFDGLGWVEQIGPTDNSAMTVSAAIFGDIQRQRMA